MVDTKVAEALIQVGGLLTSLLVARAILVRRLDLGTVPVVLQRRIEVGNRICPWLLTASAMLLLVGMTVSLVA